YYGIGLWAFSAVRIVVSTFYALQDTKTPVRMAAISVVANIIFSVILMQYLGYRGLALATSLASMLNFWLLARALKVRLGLSGWKSITESASKTMAGSFIMGAVVWAIALLIIPSEDKTLIGLFFGLMGSIFAGLVSYGFFSFFIKSPELEKVMAVVKRSMRIK
ncbi:MAG: oligosaccharide flippase family protein, partial [Deltaproteobacteria bacterium]|nr:oligosaccharide flippase family protein [Deltaproteobacteria bacterium]